MRPPKKTAGFIHQVLRKKKELSIDFAIFHFSASCVNYIFLLVWFVNVQTAEQMKSMAQGVAEAAKHTLGMGESEKERSTGDKD